MPLCHYCGKILREIPSVCRLCGHDFCFDHHRPEDHQCLRLHQYDHKPHRKICRNCGRELAVVSTCPRCGMVLCDSCQRPGNHVCRDKMTGRSPPPNR